MQKMFLKIFAFLTIITSTYQYEYTPSTDTYLLNDLLPFLNGTEFLFDGPSSVSYAPTTPTTNAKPTLEQMMYYNYYSASMYCQYQINDLSCEYCRKFKGDVNKRKVLMNNETDVTALVTLSNRRKEIVVAFRGSQNLWNAVLGLSMISVCYDNPECNIKLHVGLYTATMSLYNEVIANIGFLLSVYRNYKIVFTGHSLGAALARITTFFILYLNQFPGKKLELYSYAEPRVGNKDFADFMNAQHITTARIVARSDIVPHLIPVSVASTTILGDYYVHPQTEYWINGTEHSKFADTSLYNDPTCSDSMRPAYSVPDHFLYFDANYLVCWLNQPLVFSAVPANVFQPVGTIPPLPTVVSDFTSGAIGFATDVLGGLLG